MVEFVYGRHPSKKTEYILEKMKETLKNGKRAVLIIPEQQALYWDTLAAEKLDPTDAFNVETVSFTRLANSVFRRFGGTAGQYVGEGEKAILMWNAINAVSPLLAVFNSPERRERYVPLMLSTVSELKLYGISGEDLTEAADRMEGAVGSLPARLRDLSLIFSAYETMLLSEYDDPDDILKALERILSENDYFSGADVFIDSFYTLTPKEMKVVQCILSQADNTLITFPINENERDLPETEHINSYIKALARSVSRLGLELKVSSCKEDKKEVFSFLLSHLWDFGAEPYEKKCDDVCIVKCSDRYDEASLVAARIKELVANGASFGDIACIAADFNSLRGITDTELERHGIPVYVSGRTPVTSQPALRLLLAAGAVARGSWRREDVICALRTGLCDLSPDEADAFEIYTEKWNIQGRKKFCIPDGWAMNADGYTETESHWAAKLLELANSAREKLVPPIEAFCESLPGTLSDVCAAAYKLLCDFGVYDRLCQEVALLEGEGRLADAQKKSQVWDAVCRVLDTMAGTVPDAVVDAGSFVALLVRIADTCTIGTIPDGIDRVYLGDVDSVRLNDIKHLVILGARSGEFPRVPAENGFFSDNDKKALLSLGVELSPDTARKQKEEMFRFAKAVCSPSETLTVMIPSDSSGNHPSLGALRLMSLLPGARVLDFTGAEAERIVRTAGKLSASYERGELCADGDGISGEAKNRVFDRDITLTQSRIECFTACAFQYYCKYILKLDEGNDARLRPAEVGTFVHAILENFMRESVKEGSFPFDEATVIGRCDRLIAEYRQRTLPADCDGYVEYLFSRLTKSIKLFALSLNEEFGQSSFAPYSFEQPVGFSDELPSRPISLDNGHKMTVRGIIDRLDIMRRDGKVYVRVADYKTGSKKFSLNDVMNGHNIQLLLYLFAICDMPSDCAFSKKIAPNGEKIVPAGAVYFSARPGDILSDDILAEKDAEDFALSSISRTGIVLGDEEVIEAMDKEKKGRYAPAYVNDKGVLKGTFAEGEEAYEPIKKSLDAFLCKVGNELTRGDAASLPVGYKSSSPCQYCTMKPLCRHGKEKNTKLKEGDENNG